MKTYTVLYRIDSIMSVVDAPLGFICQADDTEHAEEQCLNAYPDCDVVWVWEGDSLQDAWADYWNVSDFEMR